MDQQTYDREIPGRGRQFPNRMRVRHYSVHAAEGRRRHRGAIRRSR